MIKMILAIAAFFLYAILVVEHDKREHEKMFGHMRFYKKNKIG